MALYYHKSNYLSLTTILTHRGIGLGQVKGLPIMGTTSGMGMVYVILTVINKVMEKGFSRSSWGEVILSKTVKGVWKGYSQKIEQGLLEFERELKPEILRACIEEDALLSKYQQYCVD